MELVPFKFIQFTNLRNILICVIKNVTFCSCSKQNGSEFEGPRLTAIGMFYVKYGKIQA
jgi:hypothetical protein